MGDFGIGYSLLCFIVVVGEFDIPALNLSDASSKIRCFVLLNLQSIYLLFVTSEIYMFFM